MLYEVYSIDNIVYTTIYICQQLFCSCQVKYSPLICICVWFLSLLSSISCSSLFTLSCILCVCVLIRVWFALSAVSLVSRLVLAVLPVKKSSVSALCIIQSSRRKAVYSFLYRQGLKYCSKNPTKIWRRWLRQRYVCINRDLFKFL